MAEARMDLPGLMQQAPAWSYLLIESLPTKQRLAVFRTCMQLARTVVRVTHNTTLNLGTKVSDDVLNVRRHAITRLLDVGQTFDVKITAPGPQPFPWTLSDKVKSLWLHHHQPRASFSFEWQDLQNLQELTWHGDVTTHEITGLCDALEQGHLEQLRCFRFMTHGISSLTLGKRLAVALGRQVTDLETLDAMLMRQLPHFKQLIAVKVYVAELQDHEVPELVSIMCSLPRLCNFHFKPFGGFSGYAAKEGSHDGFVRRGILSECTDHKHLASLLAADLHIIEFKGAVPYCEGVCLTDLLTHHAHKIICTPDDQSEFALDIFDDDHLKLLSYLQGEPILTLRKRPQLDFLPKVWAAVPSCVTTIRIKVIRGPGWQFLWHGLPTTVTRVELQFCHLSVEELAQLIASAPEHVSLLKIRADRNDTTLRAFNIGQHAPPHLSVDLTWAAYR